MDTHKKQHVLVALDEHSQPCGTQSVANTSAGWAAALQWASERDAACVSGIENSDALGIIAPGGRAAGGGNHRGLPRLSGIPLAHRARIHTTNGLGQLNEEIKRRTRVVRIFPNPETCLRSCALLTWPH